MAKDTPKGTKKANQPKVIVFGNVKGGTGKSTLCMCVITGLMYAGKRVASIDLDRRQGTLSHYIENRKRFARATAQIPVPLHFAVKQAYEPVISESEAREFEAFTRALTNAEANADFIIIDTPGTDNHLNRLAHSMADILVTPINDSVVDFDVIDYQNANAEPSLDASYYMSLVVDCHRRREAAGVSPTDWVVVRNRKATFNSFSKRAVLDKLDHLARSHGFRVADGLRDRVAFREFFPLGLTAMDPLDRQELGLRKGISHEGARQDILELMRAIGLPTPMKAPGRVHVPANQSGRSVSPESPAAKPELPPPPTPAFVADGKPLPHPAQSGPMVQPQAQSAAPVPEPRAQSPQPVQDLPRQPAPEPVRAQRMPALETTVFPPPSPQQPASNGPNPAEPVVKKTAIKGQAVSIAGHQVSQTKVSLT